MNTDTQSTLDIGSPDKKISVRDIFGLDTDLMVPAYSKKNEYVPEIDEDYLFNHETTIAILA